MATSTERSDCCLSVAVGEAVAVAPEAREPVARVSDRDGRDWRRNQRFSSHADRGPEPQLQGLRRRVRGYSDLSRLCLDRDAMVATTPAPVVRGRRLHFTAFSGDRRSCVPCHDTSGAIRLASQQGVDHHVERAAPQAPDGQETKSGATQASGDRGTHDERIYVTRTRLKGRNVQTPQTLCIGRAYSTATITLS